MDGKVGLKPKLAFLITQDWYYISHRESLALEAANQGYDVCLITQVDKHEKEILDSGIKLIPIDFYRSVKNIIQEFATIKQIYKAYRENQPNIIHQVSLKPCFYGTLAILLGAVKNNKPLIVNAFTGLGFVFTANTFYAKSLRLVLIPVFRILFKQANTHVVFQNKSDQQMFIQYRMVRPRQCHLISGSGVELERYLDNKEPEDIVTVMLVARMLIEKGVYEFVAAAKNLQKKGIIARFVLVGDTDDENPSGIAREELESWQDEGVVEWWGRQSNMPEAYSRAHIVVLPSYREGLPKVLLEAAASGRPVITTNVPGCRDAVVENETGLLVAVNAIDELADAMQFLIQNPVKRESMGKAGRELIKQHFTTEIINQEFLNIYNNFLKNKQTSEAINA